MCSIFGQIAYGALMVLCLMMTAGSLFSPGWYSDVNQKNHTGIVTCVDPELSDDVNKANCEKWWERQSNPTKATIILMSIAILVEIFAIFWTLASFCACCCRSNFLHVLPTAASFTTILLVIAMILFAVNHEIKRIDDTTTPFDATPFSTTTHNFKDDIARLDSVSYSFWIGVGAALVALAASIMGSITSCMSDTCC